MSSEMIFYTEDGVTVVQLRATDSMARLSQAQTRAV